MTAIARLTFEQSAHRIRSASTSLLIGVVALIICAAFGRPISADETEDNPFRLVLPPTIYATPGVECNIYLDNVILAPPDRKFTIHVSCPIGKSSDEGWTFTPTEEQIGEFPVTIEVLDGNQVAVTRAKATLHVGDAAAVRDRAATILMIGDSLTQASTYPRRVLELSLRPANPRLTLIGSRGPGNMPPIDDVRHEGYNGWTAEAFATLSGPLSRSGYVHRPATGSPFIYGNGRDAKLDFSRYCREFNQGVAPDFVTICLGANDIFLATDATIDAMIDRVFTNLDKLLESIRAAGPETQIGLLSLVPPSTTEDGFKGYAGRQTRAQYRRNQHRLVERLLERDARSDDPNLFLVPAHLNLDAVHNYPKADVPVSPGSRERVTVVTNGTHPAAAGYKQIGDSIYGWLINLLAEQRSPEAND